MANTYTKADAIRWLQTMQETLQASGIARYPMRGDFSKEQVVAIKAFLGPWPRALETAGLKPPRSPRTQPAADPSAPSIVTPQKGWNLK